MSSRHVVMMAMSSFRMGRRTGAKLKRVTEVFLNAQPYAAEILEGQSRLNRITGMSEWL